MQKNYFYKKRSFNKNSNNKTSFPTEELNTKSVVDINILLNRVKLAEKNELKRKIIFFSLTTLVVSLFAAFITIIK